MSVVNRMLQDIDRRLGSAGVEPLGAPAGIRSIPAAAPASRSGRTARIAVVALLCVAVAAALASSRWQGLWPSAPPSAAPIPPQPALAPAKAVEAAPAAPIEVAPSPSVATVQAAQVPAPVTAAAPPVPLVAVAEKKPAPERTVARTAAAPSSPESLKLSMQLSAPATEEPRPRLAKADQMQARPAPVRQVAADETVQAARALWNEGAHAAAVATLREALAAAEASRNPAAAAQLARELARLEMAGNRPQAAVDLLRRLEPSLGEDADAWALRGNAEQRLALHPQAAASYLAALRLRPSEGRWMLGAAISLAAAGDLAAAQAWVDQARDRGAITPPIAAYLRELGVKAPQ